uniref:Uncharacterized protein n=1 Tax=Heterosigma akashiwo TaxID=2829 RepID=A0A6V1S2R6_HETAK
MAVPKAVSIAIVSITASTTTVVVLASVVAHKLLNILFFTLLPMLSFALGACFMADPDASIKNFGIDLPDTFEANSGEGIALIRAFAGFLVLFASGAWAVGRTGCGLSKGLFCGALAALLMREHVLLSGSAAGAELALYAVLAASASFFNLVSPKVECRLQKNRCPPAVVYSKVYGRAGY